MSRFLVRWTHEASITRYTRYETTVEAEDADTALTLSRRMPSRKWGDSVDEWDEDGFGGPDDRYEILEELDKPDQVQGKPEDFGLAQMSLL